MEYMLCERYRNKLLIPHTYARHNNGKKEVIYKIKLYLPHIAPPLLDASQASFSFQIPRYTHVTPTRGTRLITIASELIIVI